MMAAKGRYVHRMSGLIYFISMNVVVASALYISVVKEIPFLLTIAIFSLYMNYNGYRVLKLKRYTYLLHDWLIVVIAVAGVAYMMYSRVPLLMIFGGILAAMLIQDVSKQFSQEDKKREYVRTKILTHIGRMVGAYIATVTAFLVVNISMNPAWLLWLLPTLIGTPVIIYYTQVWKKRLKA
jgi:uncharacterized membrane protein